MGEKVSPGGRSAIWTLMRPVGAFRLARLVSRRRLVVLTYHKVLPDSQRPLYRSRPATIVFASEFERQMQHLRRWYHAISGDELRAFLSRGGALPQHPVLITFDDGYINNYTQAFPILRKLTLPATFFVATDFVGGRQRYLWGDRLDAVLAVLPHEVFRAWSERQPLPNRHLEHDTFRLWLKASSRIRREQALAELEDLAGPAARLWLEHRAPAAMTWDQLREMAQSGMTIGSHTVSHQILASATADAVRQELSESRREIELQLVQPCWCFSYPNGEKTDFRPEDEAAVGAAGYTCAFTQIPGFVSAGSNHYALRRMPIPSSGDIAVFKSRLTGVHHWLQTCFRVDAIAK